MEVLYAKWHCVGGVGVEETQITAEHQRDKTHIL